jgi:predicted ribosome quality control (RQC) complex YloA/Tae2 family protein
MILFEHIDSNNIFIVEIGENALENEELINKSNPKDTWIHLSRYSGPHIVIHNKGKKITKDCLYRCASKLRKYKNNLPSTPVEVKYTIISNLVTRNMNPFLDIGSVICNKYKIIYI